MSSVGMLRTLKRDDVTGLSSTFILPICTRPLSSVASCSITGATMRQGPHQGAHMSRRTGIVELSTADAKVASVITAGLSLTGKGFLHCPHTGFRPCSIFSCNAIHGVAGGAADHVESRHSILRPFQPSRYFIC